MNASSRQGSSHASGEAGRRSAIARLRVGLGLAVTVTVTIFGCGSGAVPGTRSADDVTEAGIKKTFAGKNKCNPKSADRPFILEWDATDRSSLEARAANDVLFVRYEGCDLKVIEGCVNDSVRGAFGAYRPVEWTSGALETVDINDTGELYTKLPLGAATLEARVESGEKFHMEYFVSGTRTATREAIYRADLTKVPGCREATHFVYGYNLGAFAIGAQSNIKGSVDGTSVYGFGGNVNRASTSKVDKQGGVLASCRGQTARETDTCKVPIRLTLREIRDGENPDAMAARAPETDAARNLAGKLQASTDRERKAQSYADSAQKKWLARDGAGCVADLDQHDVLDPRPQNLSTSGTLATMRAQCLMLAGQCATGKALAKRAYEKTMGGQLDGSGIDRMVESTAAQNCQGGTMTARDRLLKAKADLERGANLKTTDVASCMAAYQAIKQLLPQVPPADASDSQVKMAGMYLRGNTVACLARAGDCNAAWAIYQKEPSPFMPAGMVMPEAAIKANFAAESRNKCSR
jgi:hypothetical protein